MVTTAAETAAREPTTRHDPTRRSHRLPRLFPTSMPWLIRAQVINLALLAGLALLGPSVIGHDPARQDLRARLTAPVWIGNHANHPLGTDHIGRDVLARTVYGLRTSLIVAAIGTVVSLVIGTALGALAALGGRAADAVVMFLVETQMSVPYTLVVLVLMASLGTDIRVFLLVVGLAGWEGVARLVRGQLLAAKRQDFVEGARALGLGQLRIAFRHLLPTTAPILMVLASGSFTGVIFLESSLSFLGVGIQPPGTSLGLLIGVGRDHLMGAWWIALAPCALLVSLTLSVALLGDWLRDRLDPRARRKLTRR